jgi:hypothetical protein
VSQLIDCVKGTGTYTPTTGLTLTQADCRSLVSQDPFAATALGLVPTPPGQHPGQAIDPTSLLQGPGNAQTPLPVKQATIPDVQSTNGQNLGTNGTKTYVVTQQQIDTVNYSTSTTFDAQVTDIAKNDVSVGANISIPIDIFSVGVGASVDYSSSSTKSTDASVSYAKSSTAAQTIINAAEADLSDDTNPIDTTIWLDPRYDTFMFQVKRPTVTSLSASSGWVKNQPLTIYGTGFVTGPINVEFCPQTGGACQTITGLQAPDDAHITVTAPSMPAGTTVNVQVVGVGGTSPAGPANRFTYGLPGKATLKRLGPTVAAPGTAEALTATGFNPGEPVSVTSNGQQLAAPIADGQGTLRAAFIVPSMAAGADAIRVAGQTSGRLADGTITVGPTIHPEVWAVAGGQPDIVSLLGWPAGQQVQLRWDSATGGVIGTAKTDAAGSATVPVTVPKGTLPGPHGLFATGAGRQVAISLTITSQPTPVPGGILTPPSATAGSVVVFHSGGYRPAEPVAIYFGGQVVQLTSAGPNGTVLSSFVVPSMPGQTTSVVGVGTQGSLQAAQLTVQPRLGVMPFSATPGTAVFALIFGFPPGDTVSLHWASPTGPTLRKGLVTDSFGSVSIVFNVPAQAKKGTHNVYATDSHGIQALTGFIVN